MTVLLAGVVLGSVTQQSILDLFVVSGWIVFFWTWYKALTEKKPYFTPKFLGPIGIEWAILGYFLIAALSLAVNAPEPIPWFYSMRKFTWIAELYLFIWLFSFPMPPLKKWLVFFSVTFLLPNLYALIGVYSGADPITGGDASRAIGLVNSATYHAHGNAAIFIFFFAIFLKLIPQLSKREIIAFTAAFAIMFASIFLTYTRGIWISLSISTFLLILFINWHWAVRVFVAYLVMFSILFITWEKFTMRVVSFFAGNNGDYIRKQLYEVFWLMFKEHPWIGIGYWDQYRQISSYWEKIGQYPDHFTSHAHNQYLNVLATTGSLGFFFFISIFAYFFILNIRLFKILKTSSHQILLLACLVTQIEYFLACITDVTFEYAKLRVLLVLVWALLIAIRNTSILYADQILQDSSHAAS